MAVYVNGILVGNSSYLVFPAQSSPPPNIANGQDAIYATGVGASTAIQAGSIVSVAVLCNTPLTAFVISGGNSFESPAAAVPAQLPSSPATQPFTVESGGYIE
jgi:hypothetical protein